jgi:hypothetical protein
MKTLSWNDNWFIDVDDIDENNVTISGNSDTPNNVWVKFEAGVTPRTYIITYNDGERCLQQEVSAITPCEIEWLGDTECITCDCDCTNLVLDETSVSIPMEGCDIPIGSFSTCIAEANILTAASETWADHCINTENNIIYLTVGENTSGERNSEITFNYTVCDGASCSKQLSIHQAGDSCGCGSITYSGTEEPDPTPTVEGLEYYAKIVNNTSSAIDIDDISFDFTADGSSSTEEFHNRQTIPANGNALYNHGNSICLDSCNNNYPSATISNGRITIWEGSSTSGKSVTLDKSTIVNGDTITFTYNG